MSLPKTLAFGKFLIKIGDGESPETFAAPCGLTTRGFNQTAAVNETVVPQCPPHEDDPAFIDRDVSSLSSEISGSGVLAMESFDTWNDWYFSAVSKNVQVFLDAAAANNGGHYLGAFILTAFNLTANRGSKVEVALTMLSDGEWEYVPLT